VPREGEEKEAKRDERGEQVCKFELPMRNNAKATDCKLLQALRPHALPGAAAGTTATDP